MLKVVPNESALIHREGDYSTLLVSDLHLGLEKEMATTGFRIPPYSQKGLLVVLAQRAAAALKVLFFLPCLGVLRHSAGSNTQFLSQNHDAFQQQEFVREGFRRKP